MILQTKVETAVATEKTVTYRLLEKDNFRQLLSPGMRNRNYKDDLLQGDTE